MYSIVIADDETGICEGISFLLLSSVPECRVAEIFHNGTELYHYLLENHPDILLLDIEMPGYSGLDIARFIYEQAIDTHIIMITAYNKFEYAKDALNYHVASFISKPFSSEELLDAIQKAMSVITQKRSVLDRLFHNRRTIICDLVAQDNPNQQDINLLLCNGTAGLSELQCTEIAFPDTESDTLSAQELDSRKKALRECGEEDSTLQSTFLLRRENKQITFLVFHKGTANLDFVVNVQSLLGIYSNQLVPYTQKSYPSFASYCMEKSFNRNVNHFLHHLISEGLNAAQKQLSAYIAGLTSEQTKQFVQYLTAHYQADITASDIDSILSGLAPLIESIHSSNQTPGILKDAEAYINLHYASPSFSRNELADALGVSADHLNRLFKKSYGKTLSKYLTDIRMNRAAHLLRSTNLSTVEIASSVGYYNAEYFRTAFMEYYGMTPRNYRILQEGED